MRGKRERERERGEGEKGEGVIYMCGERER